MLNPQGSRDGCPVFQLELDRALVVQRRVAPARSVPVSIPGEGSGSAGCEGEAGVMDTNTGQREAPLAWLVPVGRDYPLSENTGRVISNALCRGKQSSQSRESTCLWSNARSYNTLKSLGFADGAKLAVVGVWD